jgi:CRISPR/Cas system-associated exonuclease Cas4 (RecB family)
MITNDDIRTKVFVAFRNAQLKAMDTDRAGQLHVSDVIAPCMRKVWYGKNDKGYKSMDTESMRALYFGQIIHSHTELAKPKFHEIEMAYNYVTDKVVDLKKMKDTPLDDPIWWDIIIGSLDDLIEIDGEYVICDKKTTGSIDWFAKERTPANEGHATQLNHYRLLLKKCKNIDAKYGCIIYIDSKNSQRFEKPIIKPFRLKPIEEALENIKKNGAIVKKSMIENKMPERTICYLCSGMCPYASVCMRED